MDNIIAYVLLGYVAGVLINRAADNLPPPERRSLFVAPRCAYCGTPRRVLEQSGIAGYLFAGGRCSSCRSPLPLRGPLVEAGSILIFLFLSNRFGATWTAASYALMTACLLLITVIDAEHRLILNVVVLPFTFVALLLSPIILRLSTPYASFLIALLGASTGYLLVFAIYLFGRLFVRLMAHTRGRRIDEVAFGLGDVKLAGLIGALVGFPAVIYALIYAILLGGAAAFLVLLFQIVVRRRYAAFMAIPYGPFITIAAWVVMIWGSPSGHAI